jgi:hypothetical protein
MPIGLPRGGNGGGAGRAGPDDTLAGVQHGDRIVAGAANTRNIGGESFEIAPAVQAAHRQHPLTEITAERRMGDGDAALELRVEQVGAAGRDVGAGDRLRVVDQDLEGAGGGVVVSRLTKTLVRLGEFAGIRRLVVRQRIALHQRRILGDVG